MNSGISYKLLQKSRILRLDYFFAGCSKQKEDTKYFFHFSIAFNYFVFFEKMIYLQVKSNKKKHKKTTTKQQHKSTMPDIC